MNHPFQSIAKYKNIIIVTVGVAALASYLIPFDQIFSTADAAKPLPTCKPPGKYCNQITPKPKPPRPHLLLGAELFGLNLT
jgi:hypothetical protein